MYYLILGLENSLDNRFAPHNVKISWDHLGLLLRFSVGTAFIVGGFFGGFAKVPNFATYQVVLAAIGFCLILGDTKIVKGAGIATMLVMLWYMAHKLNLEKGFIANLNGFKREFAFLAAGGTLVMLGGGQLFTLKDFIYRTKHYFSNSAAHKEEELDINDGIAEVSVIKS